ncbi:MAG: N-acetylneuraminate synthase [bacterium]
MRIKIGNKWIGKSEPVFIIAEIGVNHNGDPDLAKKMIDIALQMGADAVKFQSFMTEKIITEAAPGAEYLMKATHGKESWFTILKSLELTKETQTQLFKYCAEKNIIFLSTPYDEESADFLNSLGVSALKIASTDLNNIPLLKHVALYGKPILLSTGMSTLEEIKQSIFTIKEEGNDHIVLLQCTSNYPPAVEDTNLNVIRTLRKECGLLVGFSDHLACVQGAIAAVALGACIYEVHYTLDRTLPGPDQKSSVEPQELQRIIDDIRFTEKLLGSGIKDVTPSEMETRQKLRKSIVATKNIIAGEKITMDKLGIKRPGTGLSPHYLYSLLGKIAKNNIKKDSLISFQDIVEETSHK